VVTSYDTAEAESIFAFAKGRIAGQHAVPRGEAITALQQQLREVVHGGGCVADIDENGTLFIHARGQRVAVQDVEGRVTVHNLTSRPPTELCPELDFDPRSNIFVGREEDTYYVPEPGKPRRRRSALAVVAEMVAAKLYGPETT
jgi:hypothetical protein